MTESEWLASTDPAAMLRRLEGKVSDRKLRLFAAGCCRLVFPRLTDPRSREAVLVAERYADGLATEGELDEAGGQVCDPGLYPSALNTAAWLCTQAVSSIVSEWGGGLLGHEVPPAAQAALLRDVCGSPFWPREDYALCAACGLWSVPDRRRHYLCPGCGSKGPFTRSPLPHPWLTRTVLTLARAACDQGREVPCGRCGGDGKVRPSEATFIQLVLGQGNECPDCGGTGRTSDGLLDDARLAVLADALEEAGCREEPLLRHLRGQGKAPPDWYRCRGCGREWKPIHKYDDCGGAACEGLEEPAEWIALCGPHAKGCWALDLVLGRA